MEFNICPLCGKEYSEHPAMSRTLPEEAICPQCELLQAVNQMAIAKAPTYCTRAIDSWVKANDSKRGFICACLWQHITLDWRDVDDYDKQENNKALVSGGRILSAYNIPTELQQGAGSNSKIWILTEANQSATTVLFPDKY